VVVGGRYAHVLDHLGVEEVFFLVILILGDICRHVEVDVYPRVEVGHLEIRICEVGIYRLLWDENLIAGVRIDHLVLTLTLILSDDDDHPLPNHPIHAYPTTYPSKDQVQQNPSPSPRKYLAKAPHYPVSMIP